MSLLSENFFPPSAPVTVPALIPQNYKDFMKINSGRAYKAGKDQVLQSGPFPCFTVTQDSAQPFGFFKEVPCSNSYFIFPLKPHEICNTPKYEKQRKFSELRFSKNDTWLEK